MKQSSIDWYVEQLVRFGFPVSVIDHWTNEAKEMHKQEINDACINGFVDDSDSAKEYYNKTFKSE